MTDPPPDVVDELYGAPLDEFIARRDARAKELRKEDRAAAEAVKKLRKPSVSAGAVNQLARTAPDDVEALLAAGSELRQAQLGGGDRDAIRSASREERDAVERLVGKAGKLSPAVLEEVRQTLHAAASDEDARELLRRGVFVEPREAVGFFGSAGVAGPRKRGNDEVAGRSRAGKDGNAARGRSRAGKDGNAARGRSRARKDDKAAKAKAEAERKRAAKERVTAARAALREAEAAAKDADRAATTAERELDRARKEAEAAHEEAERRRAELEAAEGALTSAG